MVYQVPGVGEIGLDTIILDLNGTLSVNGKVPDGVKERLDKLNEIGYTIYLFTGDQRGTADQLTKSLGINFTKTKNTQEKRESAKLLNKGKTVAIGNARIDIGTFDEAVLKIGILQSEGLHCGIIQNVDVVFTSINDAFDFLIDSDTFAATMRL